jgi:hypothetical protein
MITIMITLMTVLMGSGRGMTLMMVETAHQIRPAITK